MVGCFFAIINSVDDAPRANSIKRDRNDAAFQACPYVRARAFYAQAQAAVQAMRTQTQVKDGSLVAAPTSLGASVDDACRSHVKSFL